jgi:lipopolysaccharide transport system permease protein
MTKVILHAKPDSFSAYLQKIWLNRSLIKTIALRDLKIKYAQTFLGLAWTLVQPITAVIIFTLFFSILLKFKTPYPYILFVLTGLLLWNLFNYVFAQGSTSLTQNQELIKKMAFPKIVLPISKVIIALLEFSITFFIVLFFLFYYEISWKFTMLLSIFSIIPVILFALGLAFILSALSIYKRDLFHIVPFLINFGIWFTPVFYPVSIIPEKFINFTYINPIASAIQFMRWSLLGEAFNPFIFIGFSISFLTFIIGFFLFKNQEDKIIDVI